MKKNLITLLIMSIFNSVSSQYSSQIRIMTYNINAEKHASGSYDDIAQVIKTIDPQIAGLQKIDSCNSRNSSDVLKLLGEQTEKTGTFAPAIKNYNGSAGSYGVGFLTKEPPLAYRNLWIEHTSNEQDRAALEVSISMGGERVRIIVTHLAHEGASYRTTQISKILQWIDEISTTDPVIIMADFNAAPSENSMKQLENAGFDYVKGKDGSILDTSKSQGINHILYRPLNKWNVTDAGNPYFSASNRNPVWADIELLNPSSVCKYRSTTSDNFSLGSFKAFSDVLTFTLVKNASVSISIFNSAGQKISEIKRKQLQSGRHAFKIRQMNPGIYQCLTGIDGVFKTTKIAIVP